MNMKVLLTDKDKTYDEAELCFEQAAIWARVNCPNYVNHEVIDVSDFSGDQDIIAEYQFTDEKDAMWFKLRWE